ncbi:MAG TPA: TadE/TadG family type IV pilus assembly protein [Rhizomicrobium sp.]|nr:TadE/TadG family type IV pilus assembly protein [Rhizomicrobium sp.]
MLRIPQIRSLRRFRRDAEGLAAVEFALILPAMLIMLFGMFEVSNIVGCRARVAQLASTVADLIAQKSSLTEGDINSIYAAAGAILYPYNTDEPGIRITSVIWDSTKSANDQGAKKAGKVAWSCSKNGGGLGPQHAENSTWTFDHELLSVGSSVIMVEVDYSYDLPTKVVTGPFPMKDSFHTKPRRVAQIPKPASCPSG